MPDRTGIFLGWSANLGNFLGLGVEAGASPMYPQNMRVPPPPPGLTDSDLSYNEPVYSKQIRRRIIANYRHPPLREYLFAHLQGE